MSNAIIAKGLGGSATDLIIGRFSLGGFGIQIIIPPPPPPSGAVGAIGGRYPVDVRRPKPYEHIMIIIKYSNKVWKSEYTVSKDVRDAIVVTVEFIRALIQKVTVVTSAIVKIVRDVAVAIFVRKD